MKKIFAIMMALVLALGLGMAAVAEAPEGAEAPAEEATSAGDSAGDSAGESSPAEASPEGEEAPAEAETPMLGGLVGGWAVAENPEITEEIQAIFDKATEGLLGVNYVPVTFLGTQVVAGVNYAILCQATVVAPNAVPAWKVLFIYEDLEGNASILTIADFAFWTLCTYGAEE